MCVCERVLPSTLCTWNRQACTWTAQLVTQTRDLIRQWPLGFAVLTPAVAAGGAVSFCQVLSCMLKGKLFGSRPLSRVFTLTHTGHECVLCREV